ncbi:hypothetical protein [Pacificoceanicola onchidii]|uniref:hypothetical protein n=1 Tax=Pacificoceanicola onchidii TaxID=2562685 RepID=UPI0010A32A79|nr:hypothetical protein [Pacificoceanicola onchidii]
MTPDLFRTLVEKAAMAPSVHNVQPARWRLSGETVTLLQDTRHSLPAADPTGADVAKSLGAAFEGFSLAASEAGLTVQTTPPAATDGPLRPIAEVRLSKGADPDPLARHVPTRQSWRGGFAPATDVHRQTAETLNGQDCTAITDPHQIAEIAEVLDKASLLFLKQTAFRKELLAWMRLRRGHARWARDGMNSEAMRLSRFESLGAGVVMGPGFGLLNRFGLAETLMAEAPKTRTATAILLFHRPKDEDPFTSGRAFYRAWLRIEAAGFGAAVLAALADDPQTAQQISAEAGLSEDRRLVSAFRIGPRPDHTPFARARRSLDEVIV